MAAEIIRDGGGDYRASKLRAYADRLTARFGPKTARSPSNLLPFSWKRSLAAKLLIWPWFARHVVVDRWFLHRHEPALSPSPPLPNAPILLPAADRVPCVRDPSGT